MSFTVLGGQISCKVNLSFTGVPPVDHDRMMGNVEYARGLGLKDFSEVAAKSRRLAVVGGGPSINDHIETLKSWDGEIWAINGAWGWCENNGIDATFFAIDPHGIVGIWCNGAKRAMVGTRCDPGVFKTLERSGAEVIKFDVRPEGPVKAGSSTASSAFYLAMAQGFRDITLFGCESSYNHGQTHAYMYEPRAAQMLVFCNGEHFLTAPDYYVQAIEMRTLLREHPEFFKEESGGLLRALIADDRHRIIWISEELCMNLKPSESEPVASLEQAAA